MLLVPEVQVEEEEVVDRVVVVVVHNRQEEVEPLAVVVAVPLRRSAVVEHTRFELAVVVQRTFLKLYELYSFTTYYLIPY